jgi:protein-tyrosine phosphatase
MDNAFEGLAPFADLHSHLLPGVDDGSKSIEQSLRAMEKMRSTNTSHVCLTPHFGVQDLVPDSFEVKIAEHDSRYASVESHLPRLPKTYRGAELMLDRVPAQESLLDHRIRLAGSRYLLVEFPPQLASGAIRGLLQILIRRQVVPLVAHAERYLCGTPKEVFTWKEVGAAIQVDALTLAIGKGRKAERARAIVASGLADVIAADNHGDDRTVGMAWRYLKTVDGADQGVQLLSTNPLAILGDRAIERVNPLARRSRPSRLVAFLLGRRGKPNR